MGNSRGNVGPRDDEEVARRVISSTLGREVAVHDNGTCDRMYDLRIGSVDAPDAVIEVNSIRNETRLKTVASLEKVGRRVPLKSGLDRDWVVIVNPSTLLKKLLPRLPQLITAIDNGTINAGDVSSCRAASRARHELWNLGVHVWPNATPGVGDAIIVPSLRPNAEPMNADGERLPLWLADLFDDNEKGWANVLEKLAIPRAAEKHLYLPLGIDGPPHAITSYFADFPRLGTRTPPKSRPQLPPPITHVWIASETARMGWRWTGDSWSSFDTWPSENPSGDGQLISPSG